VVFSYLLYSEIIFGHQVIFLAGADADCVNVCIRLCSRMSVDLEHGTGDGAFSKTVTCHTGNIQMTREKR